jgi:hypothetical protein
MTGLVLVCAVSALQACGMDNSIDVIRVPGEFNSTATCFLQSSAFAAENYPPLHEGQAFKVVCGRPRLPGNVG